MNSQLLQQYTDKVIPVLRHYGVPKAAFFGSLVGGTFQEDKSDIDILVQPPAGMSFLDFVALKQDLEDRIGRSVDLVSYNGISPYLKARILSTQHVFYEQRQ